MTQQPPPRPSITPEQAARINATVRQMREAILRAAAAFGPVLAQRNRELRDKLAALQTRGTAPPHLTGRDDHDR